MKQPSLIAVLFFFLILQISCKKSEPETPLTGGQVACSFEHYVNGIPLVTDTLAYANAAGNRYMVTELMYFISDITLYHHDGSQSTIGEWQDIFYVDIAHPSSLYYQFPDVIPSGSCDSVSFIFGITGEKNLSFMYVNPPEVNMAWPEVLGGGYHYMMLNGKWIDTAGALRPFDFHLGIGQLYKSNVIHPDSIYAFVQNWFRVSLPGPAFTVTAGQVTEVTIRMNIESWFDTPTVYNHNQWGGAIMQQQPAMEIARENGKDAFILLIK